MALLKFIGLFTISNGSNWNQQGGISLWCGLWPFVVTWQLALSCGWVELWWNPPTLKKKSTIKISYLECDGWPFVCVKLLKWAWMFVTFWAYTALPLEYGSILAAMTGSWFVAIAPWPSGWAEKGMHSFVGSELSFLKLGSVLVDLVEGGGGVESFLKANVAKLLLLRSIVNWSHDKSKFWPWRGWKFSL